MPTSDTYYYPIAIDVKSTWAYTATGYSFQMTPTSDAGLWPAVFVVAGGLTNWGTDVEVYVDGSTALKVWEPSQQNTFWYSTNITIGVTSTIEIQHPSGAEVHGFGVILTNADNGANDTSIWIRRNTTVGPDANGHTYSNFGTDGDTNSFLLLGGYSALASTGTGWTPQWNNTNFSAGNRQSGPPYHALGSYGSIYTAGNFESTVASTVWGLAMYHYEVLIAAAPQAYPVTPSGTLELSGSIDWGRLTVLIFPALAGVLTLAGNYQKRLFLSLTDAVLTMSSYLRKKTGKFPSGILNLSGAWGWKFIYEKIKYTVSMWLGTTVQEVENEVRLAIGSNEGEGYGSSDQPVEAQIRMPLDDQGRR